MGYDLGGALRRGLERGRALFNGAGNSSPKDDCAVCRGAVDPDDMFACADCGRALHADCARSAGPGDEMRCPACFAKRPKKNAIKDESGLARGRDRYSNGSGPDRSFDQPNVLGCNGCDDSRAPLNREGYCEACAREQGLENASKPDLWIGARTGKAATREEAQAYADRTGMSMSLHRWSEKEQGYRPWGDDGKSLEVIWPSKRNAGPYMCSCGGILGEVAGKDDWYVCDNCGEEGPLAQHDLHAQHDVENAAGADCPCGYEFSGGYREETCPHCGRPNPKPKPADDVVQNAAGVDDLAHVLSGKCAKCGAAYGRMSMDPADYCPVGAKAFERRNAAPKCAGCGSPATKAIYPLKACPGCGERFCSSCLEGGECSMCRLRRRLKLKNASERVYLFKERADSEPLSVSVRASSEAEAWEKLGEQYQSSVEYCKHAARLVSVSDQGRDNARPLTGKCICGHEQANHENNGDAAYGPETNCLHGGCRCAAFKDENDGPRQIGGVGLGNASDPAVYKELRAVRAEVSSLMALGSKRTAADQSRLDKLLHTMWGLEKMLKEQGGELGNAAERCPICQRVDPHHAKDCPNRDAVRNAAPAVDDALGNSAGLRRGAAKYGERANAGGKHEFAGTTPGGTTKVRCPNDGEGHPLRDEWTGRFWCTGCNLEVTYAETQPK